MPYSTQTHQSSARRGRPVSVWGSLINLYRAIKTLVALFIAIGTVFYTIALVLKPFFVMLTTLSKILSGLSKVLNVFLPMRVYNHGNFGPATRSHLKAG